MVDGIARVKDDKAPCIEEAANACPRGAIIIERKEKDTDSRLPFSGYGLGRRGLRVRAGDGRGPGRGRGYGRGPGKRRR